VYNQQNGGTSYKQWYKGIEYAKGDIVWIAESDDLSDYRFLESAIKCFGNENVAIVSVGTTYFYSEQEICITDPTGIVEYINGDEFIGNEMITGNKIPNASMALFKRSEYIKVKDNGYKEFKLSGDFFLWVQLIRNNQIAIIPDKLNFCRKHPENTTNKYRSLGYDFIEGMKVLRECKKAARFEIKRKLVYIRWIDYYRLFRPHFKRGVYKKVIWNIFRSEPLLFFYLVYKQARGMFKAIKG